MRVRNRGSEGGGVVEISLGGFFKRVTSNNRFDRVLIRRCVDLKGSS